MVRNSVLAFVLLALLVSVSGCHTYGDVSLNSATDDGALASEASRQVSDGASPGRQRLVVRSAIENGTATINDTDKPVGPGLPFASGGAYYNLTGETVGSQSGRAVAVGVDLNATNATGSRIAFEDLPAVDQWALARLTEDEDAYLEPGPDWELDATYTDAQAERSVLVPTQQYDVVVYDGEAYPVSVTEDRQVTLTTYRYDATVVAESSEVYAGQLTRQYAFSFSNLSNEERSILDEASDGTYYAETPDDEAFDSLVDEFLAHEAVERDEYSGSWVLRYDGQRYWVEMNYGSFVDETSGDGVNESALEATAVDDGTASPTPSLA